MNNKVKFKGPMKTLHALAAVPFGPGCAAGSAGVYCKCKRPEFWCLQVL